MTRTTDRQHRRVLFPLAAVAGIALVLSGCGGPSSAHGAPASSSTTSARQARPGGAGGATIPGANGLVAAVTGATLQVQGKGTQTAVTYTGSTTITTTAPARASDVRLGVCVSVRAAAPSPDTAVTEPLVATTVMISSPVKGRCVAGAFPRREGLGRGDRGRPTGIPSGVRPTGTRTPGTAGGGFGGAAFGTVVALGAHGFTVRDDLPGRSPGGPATAAPRAALRAVTATASTTYTRTVAGTPASLVVGRCVTAFGKADATGALTATSIAVRPAVGGQCTGGFRGGPGNHGDGNGGGGNAGNG
jgi:hypothetical protein